MDIREHSLALISVVIGLGLTSLLGGFTGILEAFRVASADPLARGTGYMVLPGGARGIGACHSRCAR